MRVRLQGRTGLHQPEPCEKVAKLRLNGCRTQNCVAIKSLGQIAACHAFPVLRPLLRQGPTCFRRIGRPTIGTPLNMTQQHRLEAWALPDDDDLILVRFALDLFSALRITFDLVVVKQYETVCRVGACPTQLRKLSHRHIHPRKRIAGTWRQLFDHEVNGQVRCTKQIL